MAGDRGDRFLIWAKDRDGNCNHPANKFLIINSVAKFAESVEFSIQRSSINDRSW